VTSADRFAPGPDSDAYRPTPPRSIAALIADLTDEIRTLLRLELELFKTELAEKLRRLRRGLAAAVLGSVLALSGWLALLAAAILALAIVLPPWLAALTVGVAAMLVAGVLLYLAKRWLAAQRLVPRRSLSSLRQDEARLGERLP
jgi:putative superfamily III holin-X